MESRWLSAEEIAKYLGIAEDTVYRWIDRRRLPAHRVGKLWKFKTDEVKYSPVSRHYPVVFKIESSLSLTFRPAIF